MRSSVLLSGIALALSAGSVAAQYNGYATYSNTYDGVCGIGSGGLQGVSMNAAQFGGGSACGQCVQVRGTGNGAGANPISTSPFTAVITNVCPQCGWGDLELQAHGNGRWGVVWSFVGCPWGKRKLIEASQRANESQAANLKGVEATALIEPKAAGLTRSKSEPEIGLSHSLFNESGATSQHQSAPLLETSHSFLGAKSRRALK